MLANLAPSPVPGSAAPDSVAAVGLVVPAHFGPIPCPGLAAAAVVAMFLVAESRRYSAIDVVALLAFVKRTRSQNLHFDNLSQLLVACLPCRFLCHSPSFSSLSLVLFETRGPS